MAHDSAYNQLNIRCASIDPAIHDSARLSEQRMLFAVF